MKMFIASYDKYAMARDRKNMLDANVARAANIPRSTFSDWKRGRSCPKLEKLAKIAKVLEQPIESLIS